MNPKAVPAQLAPAGRAESSTAEFTRRVLIVTGVALVSVQEEIGGGLTHREESLEESAFEGIECGPVVGSLASEVAQIGRQRGDRIGLVGVGRSGENHPTASMQWVSSTNSMLQRPSFR